MDTSPKREPRLERKFPKLRNGGYSTESPRDPKYNCVALAVGDFNNFWQYMGRGRTRGYYWPPDVKDDSLESWIEVFRLHGYELCGNGDFEPGVEKVAIYVDSEGFTTHVAKQDIVIGKWASKLGKKGHDIVHDSLELLAGEEGDEYGDVKVFMKREFKGRRFPYEQAKP
ncbi:MAG TPA: hypothetical protein VLJ61_03485 [Pyrinomonadaceae bacterium]|nr:hypothetical protein [Pyrinomonadaceae bacterium]